MGASLMINIKDHNQPELFDHWNFLSPKCRELLEGSWAKLFKDEILRELPVSEFAENFSKDFGRSTKELYTVLGVLILQQIFDLTDEETINHLAFNIQWHYALNITEETDAARYMCPKTLWNMKKIVIEKELYVPLFESITDKLARVFNVDKDKQRLDSVHIQSNMCRLGRIRIFANTIRKFLVNLKRHHKKLYSQINKSLANRYISKKAFQCFSMVKKPSDTNKTLKSVSADLFELCETFKAFPQVKNMNSFKLMERVLSEQCNVIESEEGIEIELKKSKEISSSSLQNPSDPDATFSGHKGQGYHVQIMETYTETEDKEQKDATLNLITHVEVETACQSDAHALKPAIKSTKDRGLCPEELLADTLYGSDENVEYAKSKGVELIAPVKNSTSLDILSLSEFEFSSNGHISACPKGIKPFISNKNKRYSQGFAMEACSKCPDMTRCPVEKGKKYFYLRYTEKKMRIAKRRQVEKTPKFKDRYRFRSGVEATMSEYSTKTGVKRLRVRGLKAVTFCATLKAIGVNIFRAAAVKKPKDRLERAIKCLVLQILCLFLIFKERFNNICKIILKRRPNFVLNYKFA